ncbi:MAG TPA: GntR family transcriptional regulator [Smithellaceae bacterium]|nr:GntR family transcriptional regulator [Smithellaceae bacterium]
MDKKLSNKIVRDIKQRILSGTLKTGDRLPAERELAENYNVSRITVRNAISRLVYLGFLQTIPQSGTFIADFKKEASVELLVDIVSSDYEVDKAILIELLEIRRVFETYSAGRAASKMDNAQKSQLREMVNRMMDLKDEPDKLAELDYKIHSMLIDIAGNNILRLLFNSFKPIYKFYLRVFYSTPENIVGIFPYYERYCNAVDLKDDRMASFAMGELLDFAAQYTFRIIEKLPSSKWTW